MVLAKYTPEPIVNKSLAPRLCQSLQNSNPAEIQSSTTQVTSDLVTLDLWERLKRSTTTTYPEATSLTTGGT
jgi:hypothetical protein